MTVQLPDGVIVESELSGHDHQRLIEMVDHAISFFAAQFPVPLDVRIVFSCDYEADLNRLRIQSRNNKEDNSNASFIPVYFQTDETKVMDTPIIVINWSKLRCNAPQQFVESSIVHELVHYYDLSYRYTEAVVQKYGRIYEKENRSELENVIGGIYQNRSEILAKYYQEKYLLASGATELNVLYMNRFLTKIDETSRSRIFYTLAHARAQLLAWESLLPAIASPYRAQEVRQFIEDRKQELETKFPENAYFNITQLMELDAFHQYCDNLLHAPQGT